MINILKKSPIERLCASVSITPHEMALALADLNPSMRIGDVPQDKFEQVESARTHIARAIRLHSGVKTSKDEPYRAGDIFLASFPFMEAGTPEAIIKAVTDTIDDLRGTKNWEEKALNLGGRDLVRYIKETSRSGRGQHRKLDEEQGNMKMMGLLVLLLVKKIRHNRIHSGRRTKPFSHLPRHGSADEGERDIAKRASQIHVYAKNISRITGSKPGRLTSQHALYSRGCNPHTSPTSKIYSPLLIVINRYKQD